MIQFQLAETEAFAFELEKYMRNKTLLQRYWVLLVTLPFAILIFTQSGESLVDSLLSFGSWFVIAVFMAILFAFYLLNERNQKINIKYKIRANPFFLETVEIHPNDQGFLWKVKNVSVEYKFNELKKIEEFDTVFLIHTAQLGGILLPKQTGGEVDKLVERIKACIDYTPA